MRVHNVVFGWWEPFPAIKWILEQLRMSEGGSGPTEEPTGEQRREAISEEILQDFPLGELSDWSFGESEKGEPSRLLRYGFGDQSSDNNDNSDFTTPTIAELLFSTSGQYEGSYQEGHKQSVSDEPTGGDGDGSDEEAEEERNSIGSQSSIGGQTSIQVIKPHKIESTADLQSISKTLKSLTENLEPALSPKPSSNQLETVNILTTPTIVKLLFSTSGPYEASHLNQEALKRPLFSEFEKGESSRLLRDGFGNSGCGDHFNDNDYHSDFTSPTIVKLLFSSSGPYESLYSKQEALTRSEVHKSSVEDRDGSDEEAEEETSIRSPIGAHSSIQEQKVEEIGLTADLQSILKMLESLTENIEPILYPKPGSSQLEPVKISTKPATIQVINTKPAKQLLPMNTSTMPATIQVDDSKPANQVEPPKEKAVIRIDCDYSCVLKAVETFGMIQSKGSNWDILWSSIPIPRKSYSMFKPYQRANVFPDSAGLTRKNNLGALLKSMSRMFPKEYNFYPESWSLPHEWMTLKIYARAHLEDWYIVKPHDGSNGNGIFLTQHISKLRQKQGYHCQLYIQKPLIIDGLKFDLRLYVLVTSIDPLRAYVYNEALARFATVKYAKPKVTNKDNVHMHLTNYSLSRKSPTYKIDETKGTLRRFSTILDWLSQQNVDVNNVKGSIDDIIIKTLLTMLPTLKYHYRAIFPRQVHSHSSFQVFGFDVLLDKTLKPYLLEVNKTPALSADAPLDIEMVNSMVYDTFNLLNLSNANRTPSPDSAKEQIKWEDSHLGNYRKIYPNQRMEYYNEFSEAAEQFILTKPE